MDLKRVIFLRGGALGDFILSLPLYREFCRQKQAICLITRKSYRDLLPEDCYCTDFIDIDSRVYTEFFSEKPSSTNPLIPLLNNNDVYIFAVPDQTLLKNIKQSGTDRIYCLNSRPDQPPHVTIRFFNDCGMQLPDKLLETPLYSYTLTGKSLWLHPGSGSEAKNCHLETFVKLVKDRQAEFPGKVFASFGEADLELIAPTEKIFKTEGIDIETVIMPELSELKEALVSHAGMFIGNDSGVTHLASAIGIPTVALFRTTDPDIWRPIGKCTIRNC